MLSNGRLREDRKGCGKSRDKSASAGVFIMVNDNDPNAGDWPTPEFLGRLFDRYAAALELFARQWCDCPEDVVQEALIELAGQPRRRTIRRHGSIAWCGTRRSRLGARRSRRRRHETAAVGGRSGVSSARRPIGSTPAWRRRPWSRFRSNCVKWWSPGFRGGLTFQQIGQLVGVSDSAAHRRYEAALSALRQKLRTPCPKND